VGKDSTSAERQRRYIARLKAAAKAAEALRKQLAEAQAAKAAKVDPIGAISSGVTNADELAVAVRKKLAEARAASFSFLLAAANAKQLEREQGIVDVHGAELENLLAVVADIEPQDWPGQQSKATNERANKLLDTIYADLRDLTAIYKRQHRKANRRRD
jgi:hypothetical protein